MGCFTSKENKLQTTKTSGVKRKSKIIRSGFRGETLRNVTERSFIRQGFKCFRLLYKVNLPMIWLLKRKATVAGSITKVSQGTRNFWLVNCSFKFYQAFSSHLHSNKTFKKNQIWRQKYYIIMEVNKKINSANYARHSACPFVCSTALFSESPWAKASFSKRLFGNLFPLSWAAVINKQLNSITGKEPRSSVGAAAWNWRLYLQRTQKETAVSHQRRL